MKILCVIDSLGSGGAQRQMVELAKGFKELGHEVSFLIYHDIIFFKRELDEAGIPVQVIEEKSYIKRLLKMRRAIRNAHPNAVLSFLEGPNFIATFAGFPSRKWKSIVGERSANPKILKHFKLKFFRYFHLFADEVVANSFVNIKMVRSINPLLPERKCKVIYNVVNEPTKGIEEHRERRSLGKTKIVIAASYREVKNLDGLIQALKTLPDEYLHRLEIEWYGNKHMTTAGNYYYQNLKKIEDNQLASIISLNSETKSIHFSYVQSDFVGLFSHYEGFPNAVCEGMILNKPIISTKVSDIPLMIEEDINGFLCDANDSNSIANALKKAIDSTQQQRLTMGENNYQKAVTYFNKRKIVQEYLSLLS